VLAGGRSRRLSGIDKTRIRIGEQDLLELALGATTGARATVLVGPPRPTTRGVHWCREEPPFAGPAAALDAGLAHLGELTDVDGGPASIVLVLAADMPWVGDAVPALLAAYRDDGAILVDPDGRRQPLAAVYRRVAICEALAAADLRDAALSPIISGLRLAPVADPGEASLDVDTPQDLSLARARRRRKEQV
jgi:molybdopterin-guanine dinucleotide biosynthesis protein A